MSATQSLMGHILLRALGNTGGQKARSIFNQTTDIN